MVIMNKKRQIEVISQNDLDAILFERYSEDTWPNEFELNGITYSIKQSINGSYHLEVIE